MMRTRCSTSSEGDSRSRSTSTKRAGEPLGIEVHSALFDQVRTCDNHCEFCFIYQLPPGLRSSLYLKDDDYRLSFLYGNFTTLTRFTEADLERVVTEGLSPLNVSIHATDPEVRADDVAQPAGRDELALAAGAARSRHRGPRPGRGVPGSQRRAVLDDTLAGVLDQYSELASLCVVPLGVSRLQPGAGHAAAHDGRGGGRGRRRRGLAGRLPSGCSGTASCSPPTSTTCWPGGRSPTAEAYEGFPMHEDGIGMARTFELEFTRSARRASTGRAARLLRLGRRRAVRQPLRGRR